MDGTTTIALILVTLSLFFAAAIAEIGGGYLVWSWIRKRKRLVVGLVGGVILFIYGIIPTLQPGNFGRVYAAYGGIFIAFSILWGMLIDKKKPDRYEIIGSFIVLAGAVIIYYAPRNN
jgi:small multidrug resistance family-3 protein